MISYHTYVHVSSLSSFIFTYFSKAKISASTQLPYLSLLFRLELKLLESYLQDRMFSISVMFKSMIEFQLHRSCENATETGYNTIRVSYNCRTLCYETIIIMLVSLISLTKRNLISPCANFLLKAGSQITAFCLLIFVTFNENIINLFKNIGQLTLIGKYVYVIMYRQLASYQYTFVSSFSIILSSCYKQYRFNLLTPLTQQPNMCLVLASDTREIKNNS